MTENNKNESQQRLLNIEKAFTFFMVPFYYESDTAISPQKLWTEESAKLSNEGEDSEVLYSYIMDFLQGQITGMDKAKDHLQIYKLNSDKDSEWYKNFWSPMVNYANTAFIPNGKNEAKEDIFHLIKFRILSGEESGFKAPHLFVYKSANIGILTFCVELAEKKKNIGDLKLLNYYLHKINKQACRCVCPQLTINKKRVFKSEEERLSEEARYAGIRKLIVPYEDKTPYSPYNDFDWGMEGLIELLLADVEHHLFSNIRMHILTYCQIDDSQDECLSKEDILPDLLILSRCVSDKYMLPYKNLEMSGATLMSFENIYYASSVEGTAIIAVAKKSNKGFINQMDGNIRLRYIWIYMLVIIQRYTLLNLNRRLMEVNSNKDEDKFWEVIEVIKSVKIRCYYTDVSAYTQHNQFYQLCCKNLHVRETFDEIDEKIEAINININHKLENGQRRLNLVVGIMTVFQVAQAIYAFAEHQDTRYFMTGLTFIICFLLLFIVMKWDNKNLLVIAWVRRLFGIKKVSK